MGDRNLIAIWKASSFVPSWLRLLWLTKSFTEDELEQLENIDEEFHSLASSEKQAWLKWKKDNVPRTLKEWLKVFPEYKGCKRRKSRQIDFDQMVEIARVIELEEIVEEYTNLRRGGHNRLCGLCPLHDEKTPSFMLYSETNSFYCFGCNEGGDAITFIRKVEKLTFKQAVRTLYRFSRL